MTTKGLEKFVRQGTSSKAVSFFDDMALTRAIEFCKKKLNSETDSLKRQNIRRFNARLKSEIGRRNEMNEEERALDVQERIARKAVYELIRKRNQLYKGKLNGKP